jgi:serine/threonine-protein kinase RsbW
MFRTGLSSMGIAGSNPRKDRRSTSRAKSVKPGRSSRTGKSLEFSIPSDFASGRDAQKKILDEVADRGFNSQSAFAIKLALEEAMINAIKHGNKLDPKKKVHIKTRITPLQAEIEIEDEGPGFDRGDVPDPTCEENIEKCSGRGILLIEAYMNNVEWSHGGRRVRMIKRNEEANLPSE